MQKYLTAVCGAIEPLQAPGLLEAQLLRRHLLLSEEEVLINSTVTTSLTPELPTWHLETTLVQVWQFPLERELGKW